LRVINRSGGRVSVHIRPVSARPISFKRERANDTPHMMSLDHAAQQDSSWGQPWGTIEPEQNATFLLKQGVYDVRVTGVMMLMPGYSEMWFKATAPNPDPQGLDIQVAGPTQVLFISDRNSLVKDKPKEATFLELMPVDELPKRR
jgi:hypothetical protein